MKENMEELYPATYGQYPLAFTEDETNKQWMWMTEPKLTEVCQNH